MQFSVWCREHEVDTIRLHTKHLNHALTHGLSDTGSNDSSKNNYGNNTAHGFQSIGSKVTSPHPNPQPQAMLTGAPFINMDLL